MPPTSIPPRSVTLAVLAGALFLAEAASEIAHHQADRFASAGDYIVEALFALGLAAAAGAYLMLRNADSRVRIGASIAAGGQIAMAICSVATIAHGADALGPLFMLGLLASIVGPLTIASGGRSARSIGLVLAIGLLASTALPHGGAAILALAWFTSASLLRAPVIAPAALVHGAGAST